MSTRAPSISAPKAWVLAARPKTLGAAAVPVLVGTAVAWADQEQAWLAAAAALVGAMLIQIGTNLANDYFDFKNGADTEDRLGPLRVTQAGLIAEESVRNAMILTFALAAVVGSYLIYVGGWPIAAIGVASILSGIAYTGGPFPLGYHGLGDVFVFIFFGLIAVTATHYVQALEWSMVALWCSVPIGCLSVAILIVNNYRDLDTDAETGKRTLAVRMGRPATELFYMLMFLVAYAVPVIQWQIDQATFWILLPLATIPAAIALIMQLKKLEGRDLNPVLEKTAKLLVVYGVLYAAAIAVAVGG